MKDINKKIICHAHSVMTMYKDVGKDFECGGLECVIRKQSYRDSLESMKRYGLIKDYDLSNGVITTED